MPRTIEVVPYNPAWQKNYQEEAARLRPVFGSFLVELYHVGSTSIPGIFAKPIIDILAVVVDLAPMAEIELQLARLDYLARGEAGIPGRHFFLKPSLDVRTHHLHVFGAGHPEVDRHLVFRDYLRAHPQEAAGYSNLKQDLAREFTTDPPAYTDAKGPYILSVLDKAASWREMHSGEDENKIQRQL
jgi:GrpB-like predicted nucleotidyltransferase (UPF0157 family)